MERTQLLCKQTIALRFREKHRDNARYTALFKNLPVAGEVGRHYRRLSEIRKGDKNDKEKTKIFLIIAIPLLVAAAGLTAFFMIKFSYQSKYALEKCNESIFERNNTSHAVGFDLTYETD